MTDVGHEAATVLADAGIELDAGLTEAEFRSLHSRFGFEFNPDHRSMLGAALPIGARWPNWRTGTDVEITRWMNGMTDGFVTDALDSVSSFWPTSWGERPTADADVATAVRRQMATWPPLVPIYAHRYTPAAPSPTGSPVFSAWGTDVVFYGAHLLEYLRNELPFGQGVTALSTRTIHVPRWTSFVESGCRAELV